MLTNGSAPYWAGSQLCPWPIGVRLLVSAERGPGTAALGFCLGPGWRARVPGPRWRLASGRGSGITGPERGEGLCVACASPGPAPFSALGGPQPLWKPTLAGPPSRSLAQAGPAPPPLPWPHLRPALLASLECESAPTHPKPTSRGKLGPGVRVLRSRGSRSHPLSPSRSLWATFV